jgi:hypothetical protein
MVFRQDYVLLLVIVVSEVVGFTAAAVLNTTLLVQVQIVYRLKFENFFFLEVCQVPWKLLKRVSRAHWPLLLLLLLPYLLELIKKSLRACKF